MEPADLTQLTADPDIQEILQEILSPTAFLTRVWLWAAPFTIPPVEEEEPFRLPITLPIGILHFTIPPAGPAVQVFLLPITLPAA
ncbi:hypothetical protein CYMTET_5670 [Cymbomonas tetramitiformis]|uniref:Uncharacterized protein n=1 Tax=Cymbomonas tetramitiformis TaxID=36881 RepID=A0AAE0LIU5_9CHLO|nr:hypothetical protein CYMTET_5670 [Cymbomonas tetramitiformis]